MANLIGLGDNVIDLNYTTNTAYIGGNSLNFSVFAKHLGNNTAYAGMIANDVWGEKIKTVLESKGIDISHCIFFDGETGRCGIHLTDGERRIADENDGGLVKSNPLTVSPSLLEYIKTFDAVHSGCYAYMESELSKIKNIGIPVIYDFSDEWNESKLNEICPFIDIAFLSGKDLYIKEIKKHLETCVDEYECTLAISTIGKRGALIYNGKKLYKIKPYVLSSDVIDTTGAGDSWIAGFFGTYIDQHKYLDKTLSNISDSPAASQILNDMEDRIIEYCMYIGNLSARNTCLMEGSFGLGVKFSNIDRLQKGGE